MIRRAFYLAQCVGLLALAAPLLVLDALMPYREPA